MRTRRDAVQGLPAAAVQQIVELGDKALMLAGAPGFGAGSQARVKMLILLNVLPACITGMYPSSGIQVHRLSRAVRAHLLTCDKSAIS